MKTLRQIFNSVSKREIFYFMGFYALSTLVYYTASWISYGAFSGGHPSFFDYEEFFSAAGVQFFISFITTVPIWYVIFIFNKHTSLKTQLSYHFIFLPVYIACTYFALLSIKTYFGWAMSWGGYSTVWTLYFLLLFYLVQFGFLHAYNYFKRFKNEEKEKAKLRELALESQIIALKSQLNPHFLHNLFNSINATIPPENERTRALIIQLSDLFRYQNYASQHEFVTLKEELDFIENYLQIMKIRFKDRLNYSIDVPSDLYDFLIAPMLIHPLIENAIIHGISPKIEPSNLRVRITQSSHKLHVSIEDTGQGIPDHTRIFQNGLGLTNTKLRLNAMYQSDLIIEDNMPSGTKISFQI